MKKHEKYATEHKEDAHGAQDRARQVYIQLVRLGDNYYAYEATTFYDKGLGRGRKVSSYIGKIGMDGTFVPREGGSRRRRRGRRRR